jgi:phytol kinase
MSWPATLALVGLSGAVLLAIMAGVRWLGMQFGWGPELQRKAVHVATGLYATSLPLLFSERWPVLLLIGISGSVLLLLRLPRFAKTGLGSTLHGVERKSYGELLLAAAVAFTFCLSIGNPVLYVLPMAVLTLADAAAALIGTRYGRRFFEVEVGTKSAEGVAMFFMVTWIVAMIILLLLTDIGRLNVVLLSLIVAGFGALVEADSWHGLDNLFVPVGIYLFLARHLDTPPLELVLAAAAFVAALLAIISFAPLLGLTVQAARGYTVLFFLIFAVTAPYNAILPSVAVLAHLAAAKVRPCRSPHPNLDFLGAVSVVAMLWLFLGELSGVSTLNAYNLTFAGAALIFATLATSSRMLLPGVAAAALVAIVIATTGWNGERTHGQSLPWPWIVASFVPCLLVPFAWPQFLDNYRGSRALALAVPVPLVAFAGMVLWA